MSSSRGFWRNVVTVLAGTAMAQALPIALLPFLSRLFSPQEMGYYNLWLAAASLMLVPATARLDMAMFSTDTEKDATDLLRAMVLAASAVGVLVLATASWLLALTPWAGTLAPIIGYAGALALLVVVWSVFQGVLGVLIYRRSYRRLGLARFGLATGIAVAHIGGGLAGAGVDGLILGHVAGATVALCLAVYWARLSPVRLWRETAVPRLVACVRRYRAFPLVSVPAGLVNTAALLLPLVFVAARFGPEAAGWYALTSRVLNGPIGLLAWSILDVFKERAGREYRELGNCRAAYGSTFLVLGLTALVPFALLGWLGEPLFAVVFGEQWREAGHFAAILAPVFYMRFLASPLGYVVFIAEKQRYDLWWQIAVLAITLLAFGTADTLVTALRYYTVGCCAMYLVYLAMSWHFAQGPRPATAQG